MRLMLSFLANKVDALAQRFDRVSTFPIPGSSSCLGGVYTVCETCDVQGTHPLSVIIVHPSLSMLMPYIVSNLPPHNNPYSNPTTLDGKATLTLSIRTSPLNPRVLCSHLKSNIKPSTTHHLNPHHQNLM